MVDRKDRYETYPGILFEYVYPYSWDKRNKNYLELVYDRDMEELQDYFFPSPCRHCANHPRNGGSGICHCILGNPGVRC